MFWLLLPHGPALNVKLIPSQDVLQLRKQSITSPTVCLEGALPCRNPLSRKESLNPHVSLSLSLFLFFFFFFFGVWGAQRTPRAGARLVQFWRETSPFVPGPCPVKTLLQTNNRNHTQKPLRVCALSLSLSLALSFMGLGGRKGTNPRVARSLALSLSLSLSLCLCLSLSFFLAFFLSSLGRGLNSLALLLLQGLKD